MFFGINKSSVNVCFHVSLTTDGPHSQQISSWTTQIARAFLCWYGFDAGVLCRTHIRQRLDFRNLPAPSAISLFYVKSIHNALRHEDLEVEIPLDRASIDRSRSAQLGNCGGNSQHTPNRTERNAEKVWKNAVPVPPSDAEYSSGGDKPTYNVGIHKERHIPQVDAKLLLPAYARKESIQSPQIRRSTDAHCTKPANSSVPVRQCPELKKTSCVLCHTSITLGVPPKAVRSAG